jgi:hypothetical protein
MGPPAVLPVSSFRQNEPPSAARCRPDRAGSRNHLRDQTRAQNRGAGERFPSPLNSSGQMPRAEVVWSGLRFPVFFRGTGALGPARSPRPKGRGSTSTRRIRERPPAGGLAGWCRRFPPSRPPAGGLSPGLRSCSWSLVPWGGAIPRASPTPRPARPRPLLPCEKERPSGTRPHDFSPGHTEAESEHLNIVRDRPSRGPFPRRHDPRSGNPCRPGGGRRHPCWLAPGMPPAGPRKKGRGAGARPCRTRQDPLGE